MLKVKFTRIRNVVLMEVLEQSGIQRGCGHLYSAIGLELTLQSATSPELQAHNIFICGRNRDKDNKIAAITLNNEEEAREYISNAICLIDSFNDTFKPLKEKHEQFDLKDAEIFIACEKEE